jgi:uncharacterized membrane protein
MGFTFRPVTEYSSRTPGPCAGDGSGYKPGMSNSEPQTTPQSPLVPLVERLERSESIDPVASGVTPIASLTVSSPRLKNLLRGDWLGHAVHPLLTDVPIGAWTCTSLLDLVGGRRARPAANRLLTFGLAAAMPTALTGAAEWVTTTGGSRRVGVVHAIANLSAFGLYGASLVARRRGRHWRGVGLGLLGGATASIGGYLGGHLSIARKVGSRDTAFERSTAREH